MDDLQALAGSAQRLELSTGRVVELTPIRVKELPAFMAAIGALLGQMSASPDVLAMLAQNPEAVIAATAIGLRMPRAEVDELGTDDLVVAALAVIEVNADFFVRRVQPALLKASAQAVAALAGLTSSRSS